ncbi:hypothetical protein ACA910_013712 [Epithemia clementina (nom. ined.)]
MQSTTSTATTSITPRTLSTQGSNNNKYPKKVFLYISSSTTKIGLHAFFQSFGFTINDVHIPTDTFGPSKGMAFVAFQQHEDAVDALDSINGKILDNMVLHLAWAKPRNKASSSFSKRQEQVHTPKRNWSRKKKKDKNEHPK